MRLSEREIDAIRRAAREHFGQDVRVWLFGSRIDDTLKGGDIDLLVETMQAFPDCIMRAARMNAAIQLAIGEQKIDIVAVDPAAPRQPIHMNAKKQGIQLF
ncbi:MAG: nucleotidyltransferase domain-containing protein [Gammaproteobacteria bacterium]